MPTVDIHTPDGKTKGTAELPEEIFDVQVVPGARCIALGGSPGTGPEIWLVPPPGQPSATTR